MIFSERLIKAIDFAAAAHKNQTRWVSGVPYIVHPYAVGMILMTAGFSEDLVIAGLLHDVVEDTDVSLETIRQEFGQEVACLVEAVTDPQDMPLKEHTLYQVEKYKNASSEVKAIKTADILHNMYDTLQCLEQGLDVWAKLKRSKEQGLWKDQEVLKALRHNWGHPLLDEAEKCFRNLEKL